MKKLLFLVALLFLLVITSACGGSPSTEVETRQTIDSKCMEEVEYVYLAAGGELPNEDVEEILYAEYTVGEWIYLRTCWEEGWRPK